MSVNEESVFAEAQEILDPQERAAFLDRVCTNYPDLRKNVESLLSAYDAGQFLESPASVSGRRSLKRAKQTRKGTRP